MVNRLHFFSNLKIKRNTTIELNLSSNSVLLTRDEKFSKDVGETSAAIYKLCENPLRFCCTRL